MKKLRNIGILLCTAAAAVILCKYTQPEWYLLKSGTINHMNIGDIRLCILAAGMNIAIFLVYLARLLRGSRTVQQELPRPSDRASERFLDEQKKMVMEWCAYNTRCACCYGAAAMVICVIISCAYGICDAGRMATYYIPMGFVTGEIFALLVWAIQKSEAKPDKILEQLKENLNRALPESALQDKFKEEFVDTEKDWAFEELAYHYKQWGKVGNRFWSSFSSSGEVTVIDAHRVQKIEAEIHAKSVRTARVRVYRVSYRAKFYHQYASGRQEDEKALIFYRKDIIDSFLALVQKRAGETIDITNRYWKG